MKINVAVSIIALCATPAFAGFGAIAVNGPGDAWAGAYTLYSEDRAQAEALDRCYAKGSGVCTVGVSYHDACGALAVSLLGEWAAESARTRDEAENKALAACEASGGICEIQYSRCSG